jgi:hypothetical protein
MPNLGSHTAPEPGPKGPKTISFLTFLTWPLFRAAARKGGQVGKIRKRIVFIPFGPGPFPGPKGPKTIGFLTFRTWPTFRGAQRKRGPGRKSLKRMGFRIVRNWPPCFEFYACLRFRNVFAKDLIARVRFALQVYSFLTHDVIIVGSVSFEPLFSCRLDLGLAARDDPI